MARSPSLPALILGAVLLGGCATPAASDPAAAVVSDTMQPSSPVAAANPTHVPTALTAPTPAPAEAGAPDVDSVPLVAGTVVKTLADDGLRVRSEPNTGEDSYKYPRLLPLAAPLLIVDGPVSGSGYEWYEVAALTSRLPRGWVASASREGEAWISPAEFDCPDTPTAGSRSISDRMSVGVLCFPNVPITVDARLHTCNCDVDGPGYSPSWFSIGGGELLVEPDRTTAPGTMDDAMPLSLDPAGDFPDPLPLGEVVEVTGVFDHPAAASCTMTTDGGAPILSHDCRFSFAVTRLATDE